MGEQGLTRVNIESGNFNYFPWGDLFQVGFEDGLEPQLPKRYYEDAFETYRAVCDGNAVSGSTGFLQAYANYAGTFKEKALKRRLSYIFSLNGATWVKNDFGNWLAGGRRCPEMTPGYEKFMPQAASAAGGSIIGETNFYTRLRDVARSTLATSLFHFDSGISGAVFDVDIADIDFESDREKRRMAVKAGFSELYPSQPTGVYQNASGDLLVMGGNEVSWTTKDNMAHVGARLISDDGGVTKRSETVFVVRKGLGTTHPVIEHADDIIAFINGLQGDRIPDNNNPLPMSEVFSAFGYTYAGSDSAVAVSELFKNIALDYQMASSRWPTERIAMTRDGVAIRLFYNASEQYFLAAAAYIAGGEFISASSMLEEMRYKLRNAGVEIDDTLIKKVEGALHDLRERSYQKRSQPPSGGVVIGGMSQAPETGSQGSTLSQASLTIGQTTPPMPAVNNAVLSGGVLFLPWFMSICPVRAF